MTRHQSRRTQRALERELFGPEPKAAARRRPRGPRPEIVLRQYRPGDCPLCGNVCELAPGRRWTCPGCRVLYSNRDSFGDRLLKTPQVRFMTSIRCKKCAEEGEKSSVYPGLATSTLLFSAPYYDEDGRLHDHDYNTHTRSFSCSRGHSWEESEKGRPCPTCGMGFLGGGRNDP